MNSNSAYYKVLYAKHTKGSEHDDCLCFKDTALVAAKEAETALNKWWSWGADEAMERNIVPQISFTQKQEELRDNLKLAFPSLDPEMARVLAHDLSHFTWEKLGELGSKVSCTVKEAVFLVGQLGGEVSYITPGPEEPDSRVVEAMSWLGYVVEDKPVAFAVHKPEEKKGWLKSIRPKSTSVLFLQNLALHMLLSGTSWGLAMIVSVMLGIFLYPVYNQIFNEND